MAVFGVRHEPPDLEPIEEAVGAQTKVEEREGALRSRYPRLPFWAPTTKKRTCCKAASTAALPTLFGDDVLLIHCGNVSACPWCRKRRPARQPAMTFEMTI